MYGASKNPVTAPTGPSDTPSALSWAWAGPQSHPLLAASSWDGTVRIWQVQTQAPLSNQPLPSIQTGGLMGSAQRPVDPVQAITSIQPKALFNNQSPTLTCLFARDILFSGTCDKKVNMHNLVTNQTQQIGQHSMPVFKLFFHSGRNLVGAISWDREVKFWDTRSPTPAATLNLPSPAVQADANESLIAIVCEDKKVLGYDMINMNPSPLSIPIEPLSYGASCVACLPNSTGVCIGGYEGRCRFGHFQDKNSDFNFRCHRVDSARHEPVTPSTRADLVDIHTVSALGFNPTYKTLMTAGTDGYVSTWDHTTKLKIHTITPAPGDAPICCAQYDLSGRMLAIGCGYDWSQGINGRTSAMFKKSHQIVPKVVVIPMLDEWIRPKQKTQK